MLKKENYRKFILNASLAIEDYEDLNNIKEDEKIQEMYKLLNEYRRLDKELIKTRDELVEKIQETIQYIGESNFDIYDDGYVEYNNKKNG